jgi:hypothetical protein
MSVPKTAATVNQTTRHRAVDSGAINVTSIDYCGECGLWLAAVQLFDLIEIRGVTLHIEDGAVTVSPPALGDLPLVIALDPALATAISDAVIGAWIKQGAAS